MVSKTLLAIPRLSAVKGRRRRWFQCFIHIILYFSFIFTLFVNSPRIIVPPRPLMSIPRYMAIQRHHYKISCTVSISPSPHRGRRTYIAVYPPIGPAPPTSSFFGFSPIFFVSLISCPLTPFPLPFAPPFLPPTLPVLPFFTPPTSGSVVPDLVPGPFPFPSGLGSGVEDGVGVSFSIFSSWGSPYPAEVRDGRVEVNDRIRVDWVVVGRRKVNVDRSLRDVMLSCVCICFL